MSVPQCFLELRKGVLFKNNRGFLLEMYSGMYVHTRYEYPVLSSTKIVRVFNMVH